MKWQGRKRSSNIEDRRGRGASGMGKVGGGLGLGGLVILGIVWLLGGNPMELLDQAQTTGGGYEQTLTPEQQAAEDELANFVGVVLQETEVVWQQAFKKQLGRNYQAPGLVLFSGLDESACGRATAATGPFYCPADSKIYIDLSFYQDLRNRYQAPGDFAMAYVIAHEVGHHVQKLLGITQQLDAQRDRISQKEYNKLSVKLELQADFLAGMWAHHTQETEQILEDGDIEEALNAARAIGDDRLQKETRGYVVPESFTHGTSEQRMRWFKKGYESGQLEAGDTFNAITL